MMIALSEGGLGSAQRLESALADLAFVVQPNEVEWLQRFVKHAKESLTEQVSANLPDWLFVKLSNQLGGERENN
jgi:16S rRNA (cytosine967-C5)-methyltransferase